MSFSKFYSGTCIEKKRITQYDKVKGGKRMAYTIQNGAQGLAVLKIQEYLNAIRKNYPTIAEIDEDGRFGTATENAIKAFQRATGLNADGIVGGLTWDKLIEKYKTKDDDPKPHPEANDDPLEYGSDGLGVEKMQGYLNTLMPNVTRLTADGKFGAKTEARVIQFQMQHGLNANGRIDTATWDMIINLL